MTMTCPECAGRTLQNGEVYMLCTEHFQRYFREKQATETCTGAAVKDEFTRREEQHFLDTAAIHVCASIAGGSNAKVVESPEEMAEIAFSFAAALLERRRKTS